MRTATSRGNSRRGLLLTECLVYVALFSVILGLALAAFYRTLTNATHLSRNAADIVRALHAGERWREDIRRATGPVEPAPDDAPAELRIPQSGRDVFYKFTESGVWRREGTAAEWVEILPMVKSSRMTTDPRRHVRAWRWEVELQSAQKVARVRPRFTFQSVPPNSPTP